MMGLGCTTMGNPCPTVWAGRAAQPLQPTLREKEPGWPQETPRGLATIPGAIAVPSPVGTWHLAGRKEGKGLSRQMDGLFVGFCGPFSGTSAPLALLLAWSRAELCAVARLHCRQWGQHEGCDLSIKVNTVSFTQSIL